MNQVFFSTKISFVNKLTRRNYYNAEPLQFYFQPEKFTLLAFSCSVIVFCSQDLNLKGKHGFATTLIRLINYTLIF